MYAKTLYKPEYPQSVKLEMKQYTSKEVPHFFKYAKDRDESRVEPRTDSLVNRLEDLIQKPRLNFRKIKIGKPDYRLMMHDENIEFKIAFTKTGAIDRANTDPIINAYTEFTKKYYFDFDPEKDIIIDERKLYDMPDTKLKLKYNKISQEIKDQMSSFGKTDVEITDILVKYLYGLRDTRKKAALWLCYGDIIYQNLLDHGCRPTMKPVQCPDCGEWFMAPRTALNNMRCKDCKAEAQRKQSAARMRRKRERDALLRYVAD